MSLGLGASLGKTGLTTPGIVTSGLVLKQNYDTGAVVPISDGAAFFDGTDDYIEFGDNANFDLGNSDFSIAAWINKTGNTSEVIFSKGALGVAGGYSFSCGDGSSQDLWLQVESSGAYILANSSTVLASGWNYVVAVCDKSESDGLKLYINGAEAAYTGTPGDPSGITIESGTGFNARIGTKHAGGVFFTGNICNVSIWSVVLTQAQIKSIMYKNYAGLNASQITNLVSWWNLSADANDNHGSNNGTLS